MKTKVCLRRSKDSEVFLVITKGKERLCYSLNYKEYFEIKDIAWLKESKVLKWDNHTKFKELAKDIIEKDWLLVNRLNKIML